MNWQTRYIAVEHLPLAWPVAAPLLAPAVALSDGRYNLAAVYEKCREKFALLWLVDDEKDETVAAFVSRIAAYPRKKMLCIEFLGGDRMPEWVESVDHVLTNYARDAQVEGIEMAGRAGWTRPLGTLGWRQSAVTLVKPLPSEGDGS